MWCVVCGGGYDSVACMDVVLGVWCVVCGVWWGI